jgi:hypothetical protein
MASYAVPEEDAVEGEVLALVHRGMEAPAPERKGGE